MCLDNKHFDFLTEDNYATLVRYSPKEFISTSKIELPSVHEGKPVLYIADGAFSGFEIRNLILPKYLLFISDYLATSENIKFLTVSEFTPSIAKPSRTPRVAIRTKMDSSISNITLTHNFEVDDTFGVSEKYSQKVLKSQAAQKVSRSFIDYVFFAEDTEYDEVYYCNPHDIDNSLTTDYIKVYDSDGCVIVDEEGEFTLPVSEITYFLTTKLLIEADDLNKVSKTDYEFKVINDSSVILENVNKEARMLRVPPLHPEDNKYVFGTGAGIKNAKASAIYIPDGVGMVDMSVLNSTSLENMRIPETVSIFKNAEYLTIHEGVRVQVIQGSYAHQFLHMNAIINGTLDVIDGPSIKETLMKSPLMSSDRRFRLSSKDLVYLNSLLPESMGLSNVVRSESGNLLQLEDVMLEILESIYYEKPNLQRTSIFG